MICRRHRGIFIHIQKTGGTAISAALGMSAAEPDKHWLAVDVKRACDPRLWREFFKFSVVRNPWARLVSWYAMIERNRAAFEAGTKLNRLQTAALTRAKTFTEFLLNMDEDIIDSDGPKWIFRNQLDYLVDESGAWLVDYVGRTETLERDFAFISARLVGTPGPLPRVSTPPRPRYVEYYTPELIQLVSDRYARDIDCFGYRFGD